MPEQNENLAATLAEYVNAHPDEYISECAASAAALIDHYTRGAQIPVPVRQQAILEVGANLYRRRTHNQDGGATLGLDGAPGYFRPALDPITPAWPLLRPYMVGIV